MLRSPLAARALATLRSRALVVPSPLAAVSAAVHARQLATPAFREPVFSSTLPRQPSSNTIFRVDKPATLHLKSGEKFGGYAFGAPNSRFGESVFSTAITSYTESMTDPSYRGQILVLSVNLLPSPSSFEAHMRFSDFGQMLIPRVIARRR